jgi:hypothetical protein
MDCPIAAKYQPALACFSAPNQHRILQYLTHLAARQYTGLTLNAVVRVLPALLRRARSQGSKPWQTQGMALGVSRLSRIFL